MKKFLLLPLMGVLITGCNSSASKQDESAEDNFDTSALVAEEVEEVATENDAETQEIVTEEESTEDDGETTYSAPMEVTYLAEPTSWLRHYATFKLHKNGKMTGHMRFEEYWNTSKDDPWKVKDEFDVTGKWSTTLISRGEGYQKVYVIDRTDIESSSYMPDDCEYIWYGDDAYFNCENYTLQNVGKITEVKQL